jgi:hypothetical protein
MGTITEFGLLLLLILAFSAPMLANVASRIFGAPENEDEQKS